MNKQNRYIVIGVGAVVLLLLVVLVSGSKLGGPVHNIAEIFGPGIIVGSPTQAGCIKVQDSDKGGWSYITYLNGTATATGGSAANLDSTWLIPDACSEAATVQGR